MDYAKILSVINSSITSSFLSEEKQGSLSKQLDRIKKRINDNKIYLGIVGEFSTGKSTLINYLIGEDMRRQDRKKIIDAVAASIILDTYLRKVKGE